MKAASIKRNVAGNLAGRLYAAFISFAVVPIYLRLLGPEGYGLIGVFVTLQTVVMLLDLGLSPLVTRELARLSTTPESAQEQRDLVRTLETIYWLIGLLIGAAIVGLAPWIARHAFHAQTLPPATVVHAIRIIGVIMLFQWPDSFYSGALMGLERQGALNGVRILVATLQSLGALFILNFVSRTVGAYFWWMAFVWMSQTALLVSCVWKSLPLSLERPRFQRELWAKNARFMKGMTGIALSTVLLSQSDKLVVGTYMPLGDFGYYVLAANLANVLPLLFSPIYNAVFPRFAQFVALDDTAGLAQFYHKSCQLLALIVLPVAVMGVCFAHELLTVYLHDGETVRHVQPVFCLLLIGTAFNGLVTLPYALQLAYGWTSLSAYKNLLALVVVLPLLRYAVPHWGAIGGCVMVLTTNIGYFLLEVPVMHHRLLRGEMGTWYARDVGLPLAISLAAALVARLIIPTYIPVPVLLACIAGVTLTAAGCILAVMPQMRATLRRAQA